MAQEMSQFVLYSFGIAAENKAIDSDDLAVFPAEVTPFVEGELNKNPQEVETKGSSGEGEEFNLKVTEDTSITATWLRHGETNRRTSPDVRRGEGVEIWRHSDSDQFYWRSRGMDDNLRKLETIIWTISATRDESANSTHPDFCYSFEICTHTKQITLRTVKADGEPFAYTIQLNTQQGAFNIIDDVGNNIEFDSAKTLIRLFVITGAFAELNKEDINFYAPKNISALADQDISMVAGQNINVEAQSGSINAGAGQNILVDASQNALLSGGVSAGLASGGTKITLTPGGGSFEGTFNVN